MPDFYLLFSHRLTPEQEKEAKEKFKINNIYYLPPDIQAVWTQIPSSLDSIRDYINPLVEWLEKRVKPGDYILIQGDFGATFFMVQWAFKKNCIPVYATTERKVVESKNDRGDIELKRIFSHRKFRKYEKI